MELSPTMQRWAASGGSEIEYTTLELLNPAFNYKGASGRVMLVHADTEHVFTLENDAQATFYPAAISIKETATGFDVVIPGGGIDAVDQLEQWADSTEEVNIPAVFRTFLQGHDGPQRIAKGDLGTPKINAKSDLVFNVKYLSFESMAFPSVLYTKATHPGL
jgi:hypothetical protein